MGSVAQLGRHHVGIPGDRRGQHCRIDAFSRGPNGALWTTTMSSSGVLTAWTGLGGNVITAPAAVSPAAGSIEVYAVGTDHAVWRDALSGGVWFGLVAAGRNATNG